MGETTSLLLQAVRLHSDRAGIDPHLSVVPHSAEWEWDEFQGYAPERCTNKGTAFETWAQRGKARHHKVTLTMIRGWELSILGPCDAYGPSSWIGPFPADSWQVTRKIEPVWSMAHEIGEWKSAVNVDGCVEYTSQPVLVTNLALPTVGERMVV